MAVGQGLNAIVVPGIAIAPCCLIVPVVAGQRVT